MATSNFVKLFSGIILSTLFLFSFSQIGAIVYQNVTNHSSSYESRTFVGPVDISGLSEDQAIKEITSAVKSWKELNPMQLSYNGKTLNVSTEIFTFFIDRTLLEVKEGTKNSLIVSVSDSELEKEILDFVYPLTNDDVNIEKVLTDIQTNASFLLQDDQNITLQEYLSTDSLLVSTIITEATVTNFPSDFDFNSYADLFSTIKIPASSQFSLKEYMNDRTIPNDVASIIATLFYKSILPTNFEILERHHSTELPIYSDLGYEAKIGESYDFVFNNPNVTEYVLHLETTPNGLYAKLTGKPLSNSFKVEVLDSEVHEPKKIVQYDSLLSIGKTRVVEKGKQGFSATIVRHKLTEEGKLLEKQTLFKDYYPPIHQIELHSLKANIEPSGKTSSITTSDGDDSSTKGSDQTDQTDKDGTEDNNEDDTDDDVDEDEDEDEDEVPIEK
ncbi:hypothetical protein ACOI1C_03470 [Bacillus sp. DJP31]|uniref:hypothetical protein n=1 Tax=Bacillus sp. DJP31 TaxID=3409789 RepID=UPI003BB80B87